MKKLCGKIRFSFLWIPYIVILYVFHLGKSVFIVFGLLMIHELGHIVMSWYLKVKIKSLVIYPFGIFADFDNFEEYPSWYELMVSSGGVLFQIVNFIILNLLYQYNYLSLNQVDYYQLLNVQMAVFNLLPIYPLDGGRILHAVCAHFFPYSFAKVSTFIMSALVFIVCVRCVSSYWLGLFFVLYIVYLYREFDDLLYKRLSFYYNRYHLTNVLPTCVHSKNDLYQDFHNVIVSDKRYREKEWLMRFFSKKFH